MSAIGIDFGYSSIRAAMLLYTRNNENKSFNSHAYKIPVVTMNLKKTLFGSEDVDTKNVITFEAILLGLKRIIGKYDNITNSEQKLPFERIDYLFDNKNEKIKLDQKKKHSPEYLLSLLLDKVIRELKKTVAEITNINVKNAVISVPSYFTSSQREAIIHAGLMIDIKVQLLSDTAAIAAYAAFDLKEKISWKRLLIINFGASSLEVSKVELIGNVIRITANAGTTSLGGVDFDTELAKLYLRDSDYLKYYGIEAITLNPQQMSKLRRKCENAKIEIQSERITSSEIIINKMRGYPSICLTPDLFEGICKDRFDEAIYFIKKLLVDSEYRVSKYAEIVFAGGSSNLKRFKDDVEQLFFPYSVNARTLKSLDETVKGCAIIAATANARDKLSIIDTSPFNIGVKIQGTEYGFNTISNRFSTIPQTQSVLMVVENRKETNALIDIFIGDKSSFINSIKLMTISLGSFLTSLTAIKLHLLIDENGVYTFKHELFPHIQHCPVNVIATNNSTTQTEDNNEKNVNLLENVAEESRSAVKDIFDNSECKDSEEHDNCDKLGNSIKTGTKCISENNCGKSDSEKIKNYFFENMKKMLSDDFKRLNKTIGIACHYWDKNLCVDVDKFPGDYEIETIRKEIDECVLQGEHKKAEIHVKIENIMQEIDKKTNEIEKDISVSNSIDKVITSLKEFITTPKEKNLAEYTERLTQSENLNKLIDDTHFRALKERRRTKEQMLKTVRLMKQKSPFLPYKDVNIFSTYDCDIQEKLLSFESFLKDDNSGKCEADNKYKMLNDTVNSYIKQLKNEREKVKAMAGIQKSVNQLNLLLIEYKRFSLSKDETMLIGKLSSDVSQWVATLNEQNKKAEGD